MFVGSLALCLTVTAHADDGVEVLVYDGYGTPESVWLGGRVQQDEGIRRGDASRSPWGNLVDNVKRLESDEIEGAPVRVRIAGRSWKLVSDNDGLFELVLGQVRPPLPAGTHPVQVDLAVMKPAGIKGVGKIFVHGPKSTLGVISDVDDTLVQTGVTSKRSLLKNTLFKNAAQLAPVPGVSGAYRAAHEAGARAFFYVSGSPQNLYRRIREFLTRHELPSGPILLKNFGEDALLAQDRYKLARIERILNRVPQVRFVLVGDSGERDPEIYAEVARRHPERILGIVIREVPEVAKRPQRLAGMSVVADYAEARDVIARLLR